LRDHSTQVNIPAASGEMGVLANHVPSIEQLKPGLVEIVEEGGATKQYFRTSDLLPPTE
jgi:F-type H+-transporting ATPase subunit delta